MYELPLSLTQQAVIYLLIKVCEASVSPKPNSLEAFWNHGTLDWKSAVINSGPTDQYGLR